MGSPAARDLGASAFDSARGRLILFGGRIASGETYTNEVWACDLATSQWTQIAAAGTPPRERDTAAMIYDAHHDRMIVFGGLAAGGFPLLNDVWELSLSGTPTWTQLVPAGSAPPGRRAHSMVYDPGQGRAIVFGGVDDEGPDGDDNDVWQLSLDGPLQWLHILPSGSTPLARSIHVAVYDVASQRMIVYGGESFASGVLQDTWALSLTGSPQWSHLQTQGTPHQGFAAAMAFYDPGHGQMIVHGGYETSELSALSLDSPIATWTRIQTLGTATARYYHFGAFDPASARLFVFGGLFSGNTIGVPEQIDVNSGHQVITSVSDSSAGTVSVTPIVLCHGEGDAITVTATPSPGWEFVGWSGAVTGSSNPATFLLGTADANVLATFQMAPERCGSWSLLVGSGEPSGTAGSCAVLDAPRHRMLVLTGVTVNSAYVNTVRALSLGSSHAWSVLPTSGPTPTPRAGATAIYDPVRDRVLMFGGVSINNANLGDLWELSLASPTWTMLDQGGGPSARSNASMIYDPVRDRLILFGGSASGVSRNDVWTMSLSGPPTWSLLPTTGPPIARFSHVAVYDPVRDRMLVFGGSIPNQSINDLWSLPLSGSPTWTQILPYGSPPAAGRASAGVYDPVRDRLIVACGLSAGAGVATTVSNETFALSLDTPAWTRIEPRSLPAARYSHTAIYDPVDDQIVLFGGLSSVGFGASTVTSVGRFTLAGGQPLDVTVDDPLRGRAFSLGTTACYSSQQQTRVVAQPASGYAFAGWTGDASGTANPLDVTMNGPKSIVATFQFDDIVCGGWTLISGAGQPAARSPGWALRDPNRHRMLMFGGAVASGRTNDLWSLDLSSLVWSALLPAGGAPTPREGAYAAYDPVRDRVLTFGGSDGGTTYGDCFELALSGAPSWQQRVVFNTQPRSYASLVYDSARDRLLMFGGSPSANAFTNDVWALPLSGPAAWTQIATTGSPPPPRAGHGAIYDPVRDRMVVFGGAGAGPGARYQDVWVLSLSGTPTWNMIAGSLPPLGGSGPSVDYDAAGDRLIAFGGSVTGTPSHAAYALSLTSFDWTPLPIGAITPAGRSRAAGVFDPDHDRFVVFGGIGAAGTPIGAEAALSFAAGYGVEAAAAPSNGGAVLMSPARACYSDGSSVTLEAVPSPGYAFTNWSGDASGSDNPLVLMLHGDHAVIAEFTAIAAGVPGVSLQTGITGVAPNPAFGPARIRYALAAESDVRLELIDVLGRRVATLAAGRHSPGEYSITLAARRSGADRIPAGVYFLSLEAGGRRSTKRIVLAR